MHAHFSPVLGAGVFARKIFLRCVPERQMMESPGFIFLSFSPRGVDFGCYVGPVRLGHSGNTDLSNSCYPRWRFGGETDRRHSLSPEAPLVSERAFPRGVQPSFWGPNVNASKARAAGSHPPDQSGADRVTGRGGPRRSHWLGGPAGPQNQKVLHPSRTKGPKEGLQGFAGAYPLQRVPQRIWPRPPWKTASLAWQVWVAQQGCELPLPDRITAALTEPRTKHRPGSGCTETAWNAPRCFGHERPVGTETSEGNGRSSVRPAASPGRGPLRIRIRRTAQVLKIPVFSKGVQRNSRKFHGPDPLRAWARRTGVGARQAWLSQLLPSRSERVCLPPSTAVPWG